MAAATRISLKHVSKVTVVFNPFQWKTASAREFLRTLETQAVKDSNPKCQIYSEITNKSSEPKVEVLFADKEVLTFDAGKMKVADILGQFSEKCKEKEDS